MNYLSEQNIFIFLIQIFLLLGLSKSLGLFFKRWKQPALTAEILVGVILGPTILGRIWPALQISIFPKDIIQMNMLDTVAWFAVLFLLLQTGLEVDFSTAWRYKGDALKIAVTDIIVPMLIAFSICLFLPDRYLVNPAAKIAFSLFIATVMTISAMPIAARALHDLNISKTDLGLIIISALSVNDIIGWLVFTLILGFFIQANIEITKIVMLFGVTIGFTVLCLTLGRFFTNSVISRMKAKNMPEPGTSLTFICLLGLFCGAITQKIGINALFGFFLAGIMAGEARALSERTRQVISQMVFAIFVPLFFASIGLKIDFFKNFDLLLVAFISVIGISARFIGAWLGVNFTNLPKTNRLPIAIAHTPGGATEIVVGILALEYRLISEPVFVAIVCGAIISSVIFGPWLSYAIKRRKEISVLEFFNRRIITPDLKSSNRDTAIRELCEKAASQEGVPDIENIFRNVLERENAMGTAIEEGIAVPHARFNSIARPIIIFGRSISGIDWNSPDGKATQFVFLILTPESDDAIQIQILRVIAVVMSDKKTRDAILSARETQDIWGILQVALNSYNITNK